jgi:electron transfer flavoprotein alpha/beta subunit
VPTRLTVLLIDPQAERLRDLGTRIAAEGYEVVPLADAAKAQRFVQGLDSAVIVTTPEAGVDLAALLAQGRTLVVLGSRAEEEDALPEQAAFLLAAGLEPPELARRLLLVLLGRELGAGPDANLAALVGDLSRTPQIELLRGLDAAGARDR